MQSGYWVSKAGPADDLRKLSNATGRGTEPTAAVAGTFRLSYGGTSMGLLSGADYMAGGKQMEEFGFAKVFGADKTALVDFINVNSKHHIPSYDVLLECAQSTSCPYAWKTDPALKGKNVTVASVIATLPGPSAVRCHDHATGAWCHELTKVRLLKRKRQTNKKDRDRQTTKTHVKKTRQSSQRLIYFSRPSTGVQPGHVLRAVGARR